MNSRQTAYCCDCGETLYRAADESWKIRCVPCFKKHKAAQSEYGFQPNRWKIQAEQLAKQVEVLQIEISLLNQRRLQPSWIESELKERLRALIQYCHPDKHGGSSGATQLTQWLNEVRMRICA